MYLIVAIIPTFYEIYIYLFFVAVYCTLYEKKDTVYSFLISLFFPDSIRSPALSPTWGQGTKREYKEYSYSVR